MTEPNDIESVNEPPTIAQKPPYPDDVIVDGSHIAGHKYAVNELPPEFAAKIAESVRKTVEETEQHVDETVPGQIAREEERRHHNEAAQDNETEQYMEKTIDQNYNRRSGTYTNHPRGR